MQPAVSAVIHRASLIGIGLDRVKANGYVFQVEMIYLAHRLGCHIGEVPIHFPDRQYGDSKMTGTIAIEAALRVWQIKFRHRALTPFDRRSTGIQRLAILYKLSAAHSKPRRTISRASDTSKSPTTWPSEL